MKRREFIASAAATVAALALPLAEEPAPDFEPLGPLDPLGTTSAISGRWSSASSADILADIKAAIAELNAPPAPSPFRFHQFGSSFRIPPRPMIYFGDGA